MTGLATLSGWVVAAAVGAVALHLRLVLGRRRALVARVSHELRGPLCAARLGLEGLAGTGHAGRLAAIDLELRRAGLALDDLAGGREPDRIERVDLAALVREAAAGWQAVAAAHGARLAVVVPAAGPVVRADRLRLAQAAANLVVNAAEHGGGEVRVLVGRVGGRARLEVTDAGRVCRRRSRSSWARRAGAAPAAATAWPSRRRSLSATAAAWPRPPRREARASSSSCRRPTRHRCTVRRRAAAAARAGDASRLRPRGRREAAGGPPRGAAAVVSRRRRAALLLGLALVLGTLAASDVDRREAALRAEVGPPVEVVVARRPLAAGHTVRVADLGLRRLPARYAPPGGRAYREELAGRRLAVPVPAGGAVTPELLVRPATGAAGPGLRRGERAADVVATGSPESAMPGARVDVLVTGDGGDGHPGTARLALEDVEVLAAQPAPPDTDPHTAPGPRVQATLRVTVREAVYLAAAQSFARDIRLLARAPGDRRHTGAIAVEGRP